MMGAAHAAASQASAGRALRPQPPRSSPLSRAGHSLRGRRPPTAVAAPGPSVTVTVPQPPPFPSPPGQRLPVVPAAAAPPSPAPSPMPPAISRGSVVVLGSGWAAMSLIKSLGKGRDVVLVSPRNYFLYTPLLPNTATGTVEYRSIVEPVRNQIVPKGFRYIEAECTAIHPASREITCVATDAGGAAFNVGYDLLVVAVGSKVNTFGIPGVAQHCQFLKEIGDAKALRRRVSACFEQAALPGTTLERRRQLLTFIVVGGGPTGVELAAELHDTVVEDMRRLFPDPELQGCISIRLVELQDHVLAVFDREIAEYATAQFRREGIDLVLGTRVTGVDEGVLHVANAKTGVTRDLPFGTCVWCSGIKQHPLAESLKAALGPEQAPYKSLATDKWLRVRGSQGTIAALGDCATIAFDGAAAHALELWPCTPGAEGCAVDERANRAEVKAVLTKAAVLYPHLGEYAAAFDAAAAAEGTRYGSLIEYAFAAAAAGLGITPGALSAAPVGPLPLATRAARLARDLRLESLARGLESLTQGLESVTRASEQPGTRVRDAYDDVTLDADQFRAMLAALDATHRALPATAQVAKQEGEYLAAQLDAAGPSVEASPQGSGRPWFRYSHRGSLAYIGDGNAVIASPQLGIIKGWMASSMWKGFEIFSQISLRNQSLVALDWVRTKVFGRDISDV